jgi:hypothetical protein
MVTAVVYKNELRHLPEKLKQERIQQTVQNTFNIIQSQIIRAATINLTETNFTLFCIEPNQMKQKEYSYPFINWQGSPVTNVFYKEGAKYRLYENDDYPVPFVQLTPKPMCSVKMGYELYSRYYQYPYYNRDHPFHVPLDFSHNIPGIPHKNLEDSPTVYLDAFFQLLNQAFPDLSLTISKERKSETDDIFETNCCPMYIVSW